MLAKISIKLTSHFLGSAKPDKDGVRKIFMTDGKPTFYTTEFLKFCHRVAKELKLAKYTKDTIILSKYFTTTAEPNILTIKYNDVYGDPQVSKFEAYPKGTILTFTCLIDEDQITIKQLEKIFEAVGMYSGVSQFGRKKQFGSFKVETITKDEIPTGLFI